MLMCILISERGGSSHPGARRWVGKTDTARHCDDGQVPRGGNWVGKENLNRGR